MDEAGASARMHQRRPCNDGIEMLFGGRRHRIDLNTRLTGGKNVMVYGQTEVTRDLMEARAAPGCRPIYEAHVGGGARLRRHEAARDLEGRHTPRDLTATSSPAATASRRVPRQQPRAALTEYERFTTFGWLGLLSDTPPVNDELIYVNSRAAFALCSQRSKTRSRYYLQVPLTDKAEEGPTPRSGRAPLRLDDEGRARLVTGPSIEKSIARCAASSPSRCASAACSGRRRRPHRAADRRQGLNLAATDVKFRSSALIEHYRERSSDAGIDSYSERCLRHLEGRALRGGSRR